MFLVGQCIRFSIKNGIRNEQSSLLHNACKPCIVFDRRNVYLSYSGDKMNISSPWKSCVFLNPYIFRDIFFPYNRNI